MVLHGSELAPPGCALATEQKTVIFSNNVNNANNAGNTKSLENVKYCSVGHQCGQFPFGGNANVAGGEFPSSGNVNVVGGEFPSSGGVAFCCVYAAAKRRHIRNKITGWFSIFCTNRRSCSVVNFSLLSSVTKFISCLRFSIPLAD